MNGSLAPRLRALFGPLASRLLADTSRGAIARVAGSFALAHVLQAALPLLAANQLRLVLDDLAHGGGDGRRVQLLIVSWGALTLAATATNAISGLVAEALMQRLRRRVQAAVDEQAVSLDLARFETGEFHDALHRAREQAATLPSMIRSLLALASHGLSLVLIVAVLAVFQPVVALLLILVPLPVVALMFTRVRDLHDWNRALTPVERRLGYLRRLLSGREAAKEVRALDLGPTLLARAADLSGRIIAGRMRIARWKCRRDLAINTTFTVAAIAGAVWVAHGATTGRLTVGQVVMYLQFLQRGLAVFRAMQHSVLELTGDAFEVQQLAAFMALEPAMPEPERPLPAPETLRRGLTIDHVSFRYPQSTRAALTDVTLTIPAGRRVALVGSNGSGKTTLVKLLCRLYDPGEGAIAWDGTDLRAFRSSDLRRRITVAFQDFLRYELTVRENIWFGNTTLAPDDPRIDEAAGRAGAAGFISGLPRGFDTVLGKTRRRGEELSGGEWQMLALARAFSRDCPLIILDEPTSVLDADAEARLFEKLGELARGRTTVFVSHRFSSVRTADWIVLLERGRVTEQGTHETLLVQGGRYARMFGRQASQYR